ncbi:squalene/phytoene synthase family protein [Microbacterium sp.]|uniref:phytoene/squalene synthase family protein n=1 Tax=Microbacterium sp. TaxID=51671 RepID=UPI0025CC7999|nr:squalene/phytoene synthase family protein [Microbacterium sp.]
MTTSLPTYSRAAVEAAATVIGVYSTSFGLAVRLLGPRPRPHIRTVYALVRIADEVVDGAAAEAGLDPADIRRVLDELEAETLAALARGFSTNVVVHSFARTARECGIGPDLVRPFFASMRTDLDVTAHDSASHDSYVYGSAEVVGLMCLQVFLNAGSTRPQQPAADLVTGARRLGAAFQDINFLRDHAADADVLGRDYLGIDGRSVTRDDVLDRIEGDLAVANAVISSLPADCRRAVSSAHDLFAELTQRLRRTSDPGVRVRVPGIAKAAIVARAAVAAGPRRVGA